jgi:hypothetical protein
MYLLPNPKMGAFKLAAATGSKPSVPSIFDLYSNAIELVSAGCWRIQERKIVFLSQPTPAKTKKLFTTSSGKTTELNNGHPI